MSQDTDASKSMVDLDPSVPSTPTSPTGNFRWVICALLFAGLLINYIDRQILSLLKPILDEKLHWTNAQFGYINSAFQIAYAISLFSFGWLIDRFGTKLGYAISISAWSLAACGHALVGSVSGFLTARVALGLGEGGSFPASIKSVALWFPQRERALATSLFNSGANIGALLAPALVPFIALHFGWQSAFVVAGLAGFVWLAFWWAIYEVPDRSRRIGAAELAMLHQSNSTSQSQAARVALSATLRHPQAWSYVVGKLLTDPVWWFFLIWLPDYFKQTRHLDIKSSWMHLVTIYGIVTVLSIVGGWIPGRLVKAGVSASTARKGTMLGAAMLVFPIVWATSVNDWTAVLLIGLAGAAHQAWSANLYSTVSDMFPSSVVAGLVGFGSMAGSLGSILFPIVTGQMLDHFAASGQVTRGYSILFILCGCAYVVAFMIQHLLARRFEPVTITL